MEYHTSFFFMKIQIKVITNAKRTMWKDEDGNIKVYLTARPIDGQANEALIDFLAEHWGVKKSAIQIVKGLKSHYKVVNILGI
ncbi:MAG: DUF167 domain-containing protein [Candidatus Omnitrophica bacterium]|nr:DUF167 domain-containing protein [Candidatus Omnitrophota bacterium]